MQTLLNQFSQNSVEMRGTWTTEESIRFWC